MKDILKAERHQLALILEKRKNNAGLFQHLMVHAQSRLLPNVDNNIVQIMTEMKLLAIILNYLIVYIIKLNVYQKTCVEITHLLELVIH